MAARRRPTRIRMAARRTNRQFGASVMSPSKDPRTISPEAREWESEGGALATHENASLPDEVIPIAVTHYRVGSYTYTNLDDAMAEYRRRFER